MSEREYLVAEDDLDDTTNELYVNNRNNLVKRKLEIISNDKQTPTTVTPATVCNASQMTIEETRKRTVQNVNLSGHRYLGLILATVSSLFFSLCSVIVKWMTTVDPMQMAAYRFIGVLLPAIPIAIYRNENIFPAGKRLFLLLRSFVGSTGLILSFYAFRHLPLADASVIVFSVPVFVAVFARIFLKEPCTIFSIITILLTLAGVLIISKPTFLFGVENPEMLKNQPEINVWGVVAAFTSTIFGANAYILLRVLKGIHYSVIMVNFGFFALIETLSLSWILGVFCLPQCGLERVLIVALAAFSFGGQILLTTSLQLEQAGPVSIARSADIIFAFIWQVLFFQQLPTIGSVIGATLITSSVILIGARKWASNLDNDSTLKKILMIGS